MAHWYDTMGQRLSGLWLTGSNTVVTAARGVPLRSVLRYSSCVAVTPWGMTPMKPSSTSRDRRTVPGAVSSKPTGGT